MAYLSLPGALAGARERAIKTNIFMKIQKILGSGDEPPVQAGERPAPSEGIGPPTTTPLQPVFGARRRATFGGPLMFTAIAVALGIVIVLVSGHRGMGPGRANTVGSKAINPDRAESEPALRAAIDPAPVTPDAGDEPVAGPPPTPATAILGSTSAEGGHDGARARALIAAMRAKGAREDLDAVFREAGQSLKDGRVADANLMYFYAARRGHAPAAFALAGLNDPLLFDKGQSLLGKPDVAQALKWYRMAAGAGHAEAQMRLQALESWVDAEARAGDPEAERLRLSWR
jgi:hypothetical protein